MIKTIEIKRFKPFIEAQCKLRPLSFILGENGIGKSSISQALLLLKQTFTTKNARYLKLNGDLVKIGNGVDALNQFAEDDSIQITVRFLDNTTFDTLATYQQDSDLLPISISDIKQAQRIVRLPLTYLSADRLGPQLLSSFLASQAESRRVKERGENAIALLHIHQGDLLEENDPRINPSMDSLSFRSAFDFYLSEISSGASLNIEDLSYVDGVAATFAFGRRDALPTENIRPTNVGFGLSYAASIIVACLLAKKGEILIIENPEAHLHTKGQRAIAHLLAMTAMAGAQIICETHSREFLYHARRMISDKTIDEKLINLNLVFQTEKKGAAISEWFPLSRPFGDLGSEFEQFYENFGTPMDFIKAV